MSGRHARRRSRADASSLPGRASRALGWSFASNMVARTGTLPIGIVLARMLGPHSFGTFAVALLAMLALISFNDLSVSLAIVRWEGDPADIAPTVATLSVAASVLIYLACFVSAPVFAASMGAPAATSVIRVLALNVIVDGLAATPAALMQRQFRQDRRMIADQVNTWLGAAVSIGLAWRGFGAMSLAVGWMTGAVASAILLIGFSPAPLRFGFDPRAAGPLLRYGAPLAGSSLIGFAITNVDQVVVGHLLGPTALGYYTLAVNLAMWPVIMLSRPTRSVAPAVFSRLQHDPAAMRASFLTTAGLLGAVALPTCLLISGAARPLVGLVYGAPWVPAAAALTWLGLYSALRIGFELCYDFFVVHARSRVLLGVQLVWLASLIPGLMLGTLALGVPGAAMAKAAVAALVVLPCYLAQLARVGIRTWDLARRLWPSVAVTAVAAGAAALAARATRVNLDALAVTGAAGLGGFLMLTRWIRPAVAELRHTLLTSPGPGQARAAVRRSGAHRRPASGARPAAPVGTATPTRGLPAAGAGTTTAKSTQEGRQRSNDRDTAGRPDRAARRDRAGGSSGLAGRARPHLVHRRSAGRGV